MNRTHAILVSIGILGIIMTRLPMTRFSGTANPASSQHAAKRPSSEPLPATSRRLQTNQGSNANDGSSLNLMDLPEDLLGAILKTRSIIPPTTLVQFACVSRAAAAVALPALYSDLFVPSLASLPHIWRALSTRPDLADAVKSLTISEYFVKSEQLKLIVNAIQCCMLTPDSRIISVSQADKYCDPLILNNLPMPWFTRLAALCPNLRAIDMSKLAGNLAKFDYCVYFGFLDLARVLAQRKGRFTTPFNTPVAAVLVNEAHIRLPSSAGASFTTAFERDLFFVDGTIDWARKRFDVTDYVIKRKPFETFVLVPFSDLISPDPQVQAQWTVRRARIQSVYATSQADRPWLTNEWIRCKAQLWSRVGWRLGQDRMFDFSRPGEISGKVEYHCVFPELAEAALGVRHIDLPQQLDTLSIMGQSIADISPHLVNEEVGYQAGRMVRVFNTGPAKFASLSTLAISGAFFCTVDSSPRIFNVFARSLPNLIDLDLVGVQVAPDAFLASMDCLLRRKPGVGKPLTDLSVSFQVVTQYPFPLTTKRSGLASDTYKYSVATASDLRTPLNMCRATPNHLRVLTLTVDGPGYDDIGAFQIPSLAIHPGLLHGIHKMTLFSIKLFVLPLPYSHPTGPSVLPIDYIIHPAVKTAPLTHRTPIDWAHLTLRNLRTLSLTSKSILANVFSTSKSVTADFHRMPAHLPSCPALDSFDVAADDPLAAFDASTVGRTLSKYPRLIHARVGPTSMSKQQLEWLADKVLTSAEDKVLGRWPRMRDLVLYNSEAGEQVDRGLVASSAHVSDLAAAAAATLAPELVIRLRYDNAWAMSALECAFLGAGKKIGCDPMLSTCGGCGKFVKHIRNPSSARTLEVNTAYAKETGLVKKRDAILTTDPRCSCANCAVEREYMRFGNGMYGMRSGRVGQVYYLWKEGSRYPMLVE